MHCESPRKTPLVSINISNTTPAIRSCWRPFNRFPATKWRKLLGQTVARCVDLRKQCEEQVLQLRLEAANCLQMGLLHTADDKVVLSSDVHTMYLAYLIIQEYCQQVINHIPEIQSCNKKECPLDLREAIASLLYVMPRCRELVELHRMKPLFRSKFGKSFMSQVAEHSFECGVGKKIMLLLCSTAPSWPTRKKMLEKIAMDFGVDWTFESDKPAVECEPSNTKEVLKLCSSTNTTSVEPSCLIPRKELSDQGKRRRSVDSTVLTPPDSQIRSSMAQYLHQQPSHKQLGQPASMRRIKRSDSSGVQDDAQIKVEYEDAESAIQAAFHHASSAALAAQAALELSELHVNPKNDLPKEDDIDENGNNIRHMQNKPYCAGRSSRVLKYHPLPKEDDIDEYGNNIRHMQNKPYCAGRSSRVLKFQKMKGHFITSNRRSSYS